MTPPFQHFLATVSQLLPLLMPRLGGFHHLPKAPWPDSPVRQGWFPGELYGGVVEEPRQEGTTLWRARKEGLGRRKSGGPLAKQEVHGEQGRRGGEGTDRKACILSPAGVKAHPAQSGEVTSGGPGNWSPIVLGMRA